MGSEVVELARELVALKSVSSGVTDYSVEGHNELGVAARIARWMEDIGLEPTTQQASPHRVNVYATTPSDTSAPPILFEAHTDTVSAEGWPDAWNPIVRDGRLYGRGACDTKGSMAAMLVALKRVMSEGTPKRPVLFLGACGEENGFVGSKAWATLGMQAECGVVGEPTRLEIVRAHKGAARWFVRTRGTSAHSSLRDQGVNAIVRMSKVILCFERFQRDVLDNRRHELLGKGTLSVGTIHAGQAVNIVPDLCEIQVERRLLPDETAEGAWAEMEHALADDQEIDFEVEAVLKREPLPPLETPEDHAVVSAARRACEKVLGTARVSGAPYATDATVYADMGIPCIVLGPGDSAQAHTVGEYVEIEQLERAVEIYCSIMKGD